MKTLLLARHAKSDWGMPDLDDHDRTLNTRGARDAPAMAQRLIDEGLTVDRIITSTALRARSTAAAYAAAFGVTEGDGLAEEPLLYAASARSILRVASGLDPTVETAMLVGHNPGMSDAVGELTGGFVELPTCAVAICEVDVDAWAELVERTGRLLRVLTPRD